MTKLMKYYATYYGRQLNANRRHSIHRQKTESNSFLHEPLKTFLIPSTNTPLVKIKTGIGTKSYSKKNQTMQNPIMMTKMAVIYSSTTNKDIPDIQNPFHEINVVQTRTKFTNTVIITVQICRHTVTTKLTQTKDTIKVIKIRPTVHIHRAPPSNKSKTRLTIKISTTIPIKIPESCPLIAYSSTVG